MIDLESRLEASGGLVCSFSKVFASKCTYPRVGGCWRLNFFAPFAAAFALARMFAMTCSGACAYT